MKNLLIWKQTDTFETCGYIHTDPGTCLFIIEHGDLSTPKPGPFYVSGVSVPDQAEFEKSAEFATIELAQEQAEKFLADWIWSTVIPLVVTPGGYDILVERKRQIEGTSRNPEGRSLEDDKKHHTHRELAHAALCYLCWYIGLDRIEETLQAYWPWDRKWWRSGGVRSVRSLEKAGALIAAEIDRLSLGKEGE